MITFFKQWHCYTHRYSIVGYNGGGLHDRLGPTWSIWMVPGTVEARE